MSILSKEEMFAKLKERIGEDTSDEAVTFVEDFTDTINDMETKLATTDSEWKKKYEENDNEWRTKYRDRFLSTSPEEVKKKQEENVRNDGEVKSFEELFTLKEG